MLVRARRALPAPPDVAAEVGRFALTGLAAYSTDVAAFNVLLLVVHADPLVAKGLASAAAIAVAYVGSRHLSWPGRLRSGPVRAALTFVVVSLAGVAVQGLCLWLSHRVLGLTSPLADNVSANVVGMALATAVRFWGFRRLVFGVEAAARDARLSSASSSARGSLCAGQAIRARRQQPECQSVPQTGPVTSRWPAESRP